MIRIAPAERDGLPAPGETPRILFQDADLLVVDKPAGWLTHPDGAGRRPDVVSALGGGLGVHQRLDVDTSGVLCFSRSPAGAKALAATFEGRSGEKRYLAVVEGRPPAARGRLDAPVAGAAAETRYAVRATDDGWTCLDVHPVTGRRHQIRAHLAGAGCPVRGDQRYGDPLDVRAPRLLLHCAAIALADGRRFEAATPPPFARYVGGDLRAGLRADPGTTSFREVHGAADGWPGCTVDRYDDWLWVERAPEAGERPLPSARGVFLVESMADRSRGAQPAPRLLAGEAPPRPLRVLEHGVAFLVDLSPEQLSTGLFLDQRPQRAWLARHAAGMRVLNTFAHAGAFSVAAAVAGAETVSVDLSRRWLERIPLQLQENSVDPARHDLIWGDVFDWLRRLGNRGERFDLVILDPPGTSVGKGNKRWSAARDYPALTALAAPLVAPGGALWTATNVRALPPARFAGLVARGLPAGFALERVCPPPVDHPTDGPADVKTFVWRRG